MYRSRAYISAASRCRPPVILRRFLRSRFPQADLQKHQQCRRSGKAQGCRCQQARESSGRPDRAARQAHRRPAGRGRRARSRSSPRPRATGRACRPRSRSCVRQVSILEQNIATTQAEYDYQRPCSESAVQATYRAGQLVLPRHPAGRQGPRRPHRPHRVRQPGHRGQSTRCDPARHHQAQPAVVSGQDAGRPLTQVSEKRAEATAVEKRWRELRGRRQGKVNEQQSVFGQKKSACLPRREERRAPRADRRRRGAELRPASPPNWLPEVADRRLQRRDGVAGPGALRDHSSGFGWRIHPILGTAEFHSGIDIGAPSGSAIVAAGSGTVIYGGLPRRLRQHRSMIDHGNGVTSLYAHQARRHQRGRGAARVARASASARSAAPGCRPGRTCTSRCASTANP